MPMLMDTYKLVTLDLTEFALVFRSWVVRAKHLIMTALKEQLLNAKIWTGSSL